LRSHHSLPLRYSAGDLVQWENSQLTVIGVGRHRLWLQKSSNGKSLSSLSSLVSSHLITTAAVGDVLGFTRDTLHQLISKNALRLLKKTNFFKTTLKCFSSSPLSTLPPP
jgi:hypothetical protein